MIRWPWVSRARYDLLQHNAAESRTLANNAQHTAKTLSTMLDNAAAQYNILLDKYHSLRVIGAVEIPNVIPTARQLERLQVADNAEPDELRALIHERAGSDYRKRGMMLRQLTADRAAGVSDDKIRQQIERGIEGNGVPT